ncbi:MAG TPA: hypothetical protein VM617_06335, partial [Thermoanaerobaculia bacterium]|nr:hypothetical protein [Thermoanaerobaculia bacterium]
GLAAIQLLPLTATLLASSRWQAHGAAGDPPSLALLLVQPLRLVLPDLFGNPAAGTWWGSFYWPSTAVYAGAITLPLAAAGLAATRRAGGGVDRRWLGVAAMLAFAFLAAYHLPPVRQLLAEVPVVGRALHHRLLFAVDLTLALLAGAGVDRWRVGRGRGLIAGSALVLGMLALAWWLFREEWLARGLLAGQTAWTLWSVVAALLLVAALAAPSRWRPRLAAFLPVVLVVDLVVAHAGFNRALPLADLYPVTGAVAFLSERPGRIAAPGEVLRPNAAMVYRLHDIRGDDSVKSVRYEALLEEVFAAGHPTFFRPLAEWDPEWLDRLAVRWIVTPPGSAAPPVPASLAYDGADARVWRRPSPRPAVRWAGTPTGCTAAVVAATPGRWEVDWSCAEEGRLVVAESWDPGWRARTGTGRRLAVEPVERVLLGVVLGPGSGRVVLAYRPVGLLAGALLSAAALLVLFAALLARRRKRRRDAAALPRGVIGEAR